MAKKVIKNTGNQPIYLNLPGGRSIKIPARSAVEVNESDYQSTEMAFHRNRGNVTEIETPTAVVKEKTGVKSGVTKKSPGESKPDEESKTKEKAESGKSTKSE